MSQNQEALAGIEMIKRAQSVEQHEHLSATGHAVEDIEIEIWFQLGQICEDIEEIRRWIEAYSVLYFV